MQVFLNFINQPPNYLRMIPQSITSSFTHCSDGDGDDKIPYYDCVYLCIKYETDIKYKCVKFDSYEKAEAYYTSIYSHRANNFTKKYIPFCAYTPMCLHNMILDFKLKDKFFK